MTPERIPLTIWIEYDARRLMGTFRREGTADAAIWQRMRQAALTLGEYSFTDDSLTLPWTSVLSFVREFGPLQRRHDFRFRPTVSARPEVVRFLDELRAVGRARERMAVVSPSADPTTRLRSVGFRRRQLTDFQVRDLQHLLALRNGANFSVPGAGKTTVTLALHLLTQSEGRKLLVVAPKSAFVAWKEVVNDCIDSDAPAWVSEPFTVLTGGREGVRRHLATDANRFLVNYELLVSIPDLFSLFLSRNPVHLVLDESHRMKGGYGVKRGVVLLTNATLPVRRDILSGTPMPRSADDLRSQLDFLWPGSGLGQRIASGAPPREVVGNLYVRTTKADLGLPPIRRTFHRVDMSRAQLALYSLVRSALLSEFGGARIQKTIDLARARRSVIRLLQLSSNPVLALAGMTRQDGIESDIVRRVIDDGPSAKMREVAEFVRGLAHQGRKVILWSIFTDTIIQMERMLADVNPVTIYGAVPSGDPRDDDTREGRLQRFHEDPNCMAVIANPATAGEGISLHHICHDAVYLDRTYNATHYLQSIDRIHRLGLRDDVNTNVFVFQTTTPRGIGCIDYSVSRSLARKTKDLEVLLNDTDLREIALDEEHAEEPIDYSIEPEDLADLIAELEGSGRDDQGACA